ncbi:putative conserved protein related to C-terminal domain of eukaryotic chaperone, SACSIN [Pyrobaculum oguniense TE7]|uniref:Conserved protein related to C-terminal domain of eukaryotic chaperone, SACSIN n=1 Tax=Pyrobaculum oguniense (strain DSM 13380 / JCM 10595 / TE7) TaxID=698757 RepID=H6Q6Q8_PYROT|nr:putative conserved protein related to C-terminal domain of eukaryotic chaperone, SACSIN [Pyrobaculum oguniense TE7]
MERLGGIHLQWYQRHLEHLALTYENMEKGDLRDTCYHAYQAVSALLSGLLGLDPQHPGAIFKTLTSMARMVAEELPPDVANCAELLEKNYFHGNEMCLGCAELLIDYFHRYLTV